MGLKDKLSYIKGYVDGKSLLKKNDEESFVLEKVLELLDDMIDKIEELDDGQYTLSQQVDEIDDDLYDLEKFVYDEDDEDYDDEDYDDDYYDDEDMVACPNCKTKFELEEEDDDDNLVCPNCGNKFTYEEGCEAYYNDEDND